MSGLLIGLIVLTAAQAAANLLLVAALKRLPAPEVSESGVALIGAGARERLR